MKAANAKQASELVNAHGALPAVAHALSEKPGKYHECVHLELSAAEIQGGEGQGASFYCTVPAATGRKIVAAARQIVKADLKRLGVSLKD